MRIAALQPFTLSDYPGKPAAIIFTQGCNYTCPFCHNRALWDCNKQGEISPFEVIDFIKKRTGILDGLVITGGEPTLQPGLHDFIGQIKQLGIAIKLDTNGSNPEKVKELINDNLIDCIAMDVKAPWEKYHLLCGCQVNLEAIRRSIQLIAGSGLDHLFRTTFYPDLLSKSDIDQIKELLPPSSHYIVQQFKEVDMALH